ncbi:urate hydroxylase PuuD, partial [Stenotrophomonas maltophilia]|uniref:urate hydroxylase PuuD n=1 Tax=Stenotrophomonas maltophilia TaxID=40324 RepID=UPI0019538659
RQSPWRSLDFQCQDENITTFCVFKGNASRTRLTAKIGRTTNMDPIVAEWGSLLLRWVHVVTAIAWIGS